MRGQVFMNDECYPIGGTTITVAIRVLTVAYAEISANAEADWIYCQMPSGRRFWRCPTCSSCR